MNKKGAAYSTSDYLGFSLLVTLFVLIMIIGIFAYVRGIIIHANDGPLPVVEQRIIEMRALHSEECFAYTEQGRAYSGLFDKEKLSQQRMRDCLPLTNTFGRGVQIIIEYEDANQDIIREVFRTQNVASGMSTSLMRTSITYPIKVKDEGFGTITFTHTN